MKAKLGPIAFEALEFIRTGGSRVRGGDLGGEAWINLAEGKRAGTV